MALVALLWVGGLVVGDAGAGDSPGQILALSEVAVQQNFAVRVASEEASQNETEVLPPLSAEFSFMIVFFSSRGDNVWTPEALEAIWLTEQGLIGRDSSRFAISDFDRYCHVPVAGAGCAPPLSPVQLFFPGVPYSSITRSDVAGLSQGVIDAGLAAATSPAQLRFTDFFFDSALRSNAVGASPVYQGKVTRTRIGFGGPLNETKVEGGVVVQRYDNLLDEEREQITTFEGWVGQYLDFFAAPDPAGMFINFFEPNLGNVEVIGLVQGDFVLAGLAGVMVVVIVGVQTGSWALAAVGMANVGLSYPIGLVLYHGMLGIQVNTQLNQLALYIILGIGADDIFVMIDAWRQSGLEDEEAVGVPGPDGLHKRFGWVWRRAAASMLITSLTTFVAFIMTAVSPIPAVSAFGVLAALMVFVNYVGIITMYAAFLVIWHRHFAASCCVVWPKEEADYCPECCCAGACLAPSTRALRAAAAMDAAAAAAAEAVEGGGALGKDVGGTGVELGPTPASAATATATSPPRHVVRRVPSRLAVELDVTEHRWIERFCYTTWADALFRARYVIAAVGIILIAVSIAGAIELRPPEEEESGLPPNSELQQAVNRFNDFPPSAQSFVNEVVMMYGVNPDRAIDRSGLDPNDEFNNGELVLEGAPAFMPHLAAVQEYMTDAACTATAAAAIPGRPGGETFALFGVEADCWLAEWAGWRRNATAGGIGPLWVDMTPTAFKTSLGAWFATLDEERQGEMRLQAGDIDDSTVATTPWLIFTFNSTMPNNPPLSDLETYFDGWTDRMDTVNGAAPEGARRGFVSNGNFAWFVTASVLVQSTYSSIGVSFAVAVLFLVLSSGNFIVAGLASVAIVGIVLGLLAFLAVLPDVNLGLVESINATILVGLAVDYTVHLAHSYNAASQTGRFKRARHALFEIGVSVLGGAITSLTSAFVLFFASLTFFIRFGQLIFATLFLSLLFSTVWFMAMLMIVGPDAHPTGDVMPLLRACCGLAAPAPEEEGEVMKPRAGTPQGMASAPPVKVAVEMVQVAPAPATPSQEEEGEEEGEVQEEAAPEQEGEVSGTEGSDTAAPIASADEASPEAKDDSPPPPAQAGGWTVTSMDSGGESKGAEEEAAPAASEQD